MQRLAGHDGIERERHEERCSCDKRKHGVEEGERERTAQADG